MHRGKMSANASLVSENSVGGGTPNACGMSRRGFIQFGGALALSVALPLGGLSALTGCRSAAGDELLLGERTITDHAGREVTVPVASSLERVYFTSALAQVFVFSLIPQLQAGTAITFSQQELAMMPDYMADLPNLGSLSSNGEIDREELIARDVQVVFSISGTDLTASNISEAEKLQDQTGIPVVLIDGSFSRIAEAYRFLGGILGCADRAEELATYLEDVYENVSSAVATVPESERVSVYYAEGPLGLQTEPDESQHALAFAVAGAKNVAAVDANQGLGMSNVSLEQVIAWDPEVIVAWDDAIRGGADEIIRTKDTWAGIRAVKNERVYTMPNAPFAWLDRPPGVNRFIGIQWLANMLYPDAYDVDMVDVTRDFYSRMYWCDITVDQALDLLGNSYPPVGRQAKYTYSGDATHGGSSSSGLSNDALTQRQAGAD